MGPQQQNLKAKLISNGAGAYTASAYLKLASGTDIGQIQIGLTDDNGTTYHAVTGAISASGWARVSGTTNLSWVGTLATATFFVNTAASTANLYVDECSLMKVPVATPAISPGGGLHIDSVEVTLACATEGATIGYTLDGSTPTTASPAYSGPFTLTSNATVKVIAWKAGMPNSAVASADFIVTSASQVLMPTITPNGGTHIDSVAVTLASLTEGASLSFTLDGTPPTTNSLLYVAPFTLTSNATVRAIAWKAGMSDSAVVSADFVVAVATPTFSPNGGAFVGSVDVALACSSPGAAICYTTDGSVPTTNSPAYSGPFTLSASTTVKALAWKSGITDSAVASASFSATVSTPVIAPNGGPFTNCVEVTLACDTPGAEIRFTSDGSTPGTAAGTFVTYAGPFTISSGTVKAYGSRSGDANSAVVSATFGNTAPDPWTLIRVPGRIEAEHYRAGAENAAYHDTSSGNSGHLYRADRVDLEFCGDTGGGYNVGWAAVGEWLTYNIDVVHANQYDFIFRVASATAGTKAMSVQIDGAAAGTVDFTYADGWQTYHDVAIPGVSLTAGAHQVKVTFDTANCNFNYLDLVAWPPRGTLISVY